MCSSHSGHEFLGCHHDVRELLHYADVVIPELPQDDAEGHPREGESPHQPHIPDGEGLDQVILVAEKEGQVHGSTVIAELGLCTLPREVTDPPAAFVASLRHEAPAGLHAIGT